MTLHAGPAYEQGQVTIGPPEPTVLQMAARSSDLESEVNRWTRVGEEQDDAYHFAVYRGHDLVGQIFLHDIDWRVGSALVGYHLFEKFRGQGIGTIALRLLQSFVVDKTPLSRLVVITTAQNFASRRIAEKCGFVFVGPHREDPTGVCL